MVGGGGSGLAAAIEARSTGRSVALIEKNPALGGSTAWSIGSISASSTPHQLAKGIQDSPADHWRDMAGFNGDLDPRDNRDLRRVLADAMPDTFRWLLSHGIRFYGPMPEPPHKKPRMHNVLPNSRSFIVHLGRAARRAGVDILCSTRAVALSSDAGRVDGIDCETPKGKRRFSARGGVVLASGDFTSDPELKAPFHGTARSQGGRRQHHGDGRRPEARAPPRRPHPQRRPRARAGAALHTAAAAEPAAQAAALAGARQPDGLVARAYAERHPAPLRDELRDDGAGALAGAVHGRGDPRQRGRQALHRRDRRAGVRAPRSAGQGRLHPARRAHRREVFGLAALHLDRAGRGLCLRRRLPAQPARRVHGGADAARSWRTISACRSSSLAKAVAQYNETAGNRPKLGDGPYVALGPVRAVFVHAEGGLAVDAEHRVLGAGDQPIPGLYAAGSTGQGGLLLKGHGHHLAWAFASGRRAGRNAAFRATTPDTVA